ncbi:MAG: GNAT family N-acetyltransferase [Deltaproteobacteria bacterium]|nr:GNAT family N-acetyltransferase [Deltaproteobacteria bacterium]
MKIRAAVSTDRNRILDITRGVGNFTEKEIKVAMEVVDQSCEGNGEYITLCVVGDKDIAVGYASFGLIPLTESSYDLYWIAVDREQQQRGYGHLLLDRVETEIIDGGGDRLFVETSSGSDYIYSRQFYERRGYSKVATINDFYWKGNDKIIYVKKLEGEY